VVTRPPSTIHRGDVVVVRNGRGILIKRVAHTAGDRIFQIRIGDYWLDSMEAESEKFDKETPFIRRCKLARRTYEIPKGFAYLLGDNRAGSIDSRMFGAVPISNIIGTVVNPRPRVIAD
jgi:signal peptidase I